MITDERVVSNFGDWVRTEELKKIVQIVTPNIAASKIGVTERVVVGSLAEQCPTLAWIRDYENNPYNGTKEFESGEQCKFNFVGFSENLGNGLLSYAAKYNIYILS